MLDLMAFVSTAMAHLKWLFLQAQEGKETWDCIDLIPLNRKFSQVAQKLWWSLLPLKLNSSWEWPRVDSNACDQETTMTKMATSLRIFGCQVVTNSSSCPILHGRRFPLTISSVVRLEQLKSPRRNGCSRQTDRQKGPTDQWPPKQCEAWPLILWIIVHPPAFIPLQILSLSASPSIHLPLTRLPGSLPCWRLYRPSLKLKNQIKRDFCLSFFPGICEDSQCLFACGSGSLVAGVWFI